MKFSWTSFDSMMKNFLRILIKLIALGMCILVIGLIVGKIYTDKIIPFWITKMGVGWTIRRIMLLIGLGIVCFLIARKGPGGVAMLIMLGSAAVWLAVIQDYDPEVQTWTLFLIIPGLVSYAGFVVRICDFFLQKLR